ncbi:MAG: hypothetical protein ACXQTG_04250 [Methanoculleaceae archaeon]
MRSPEPGSRVDIRDLIEVQRRGTDVYLLFERDCAGVPPDELLRRFHDVPEENRPFIRVDAFIRFGTTNDPGFLRRLDELPLIIEITGRGEYHTEGTRRSYLAGLMPFIDEIDFEAEEGPETGHFDCS